MKRFLFLIPLLAMLPSCEKETPVTPFPFADFQKRGQSENLVHFAKDIEDQFLTPNGIFTFWRYLRFPKDGACTIPLYDEPKLSQTRILAYCEVAGGYLFYHDIFGLINSRRESWDDYKPFLDEATVTHCYPSFWKDGVVYPTPKAACDFGAASKKDFLALTDDSFISTTTPYVEQYILGANGDWPGSSYYGESERQRFINDHGYKASRDDAVEQAKLDYYNQFYVEKGIKDDRSLSHPDYLQARLVEQRSITCFRYYQNDESAMILSFDVNGYARGRRYSEGGFRAIDLLYSGQALDPVLYYQRQFYSLEEAISQSLLTQDEVARFYSDGIVYEYWGIADYFEAPSLTV